MKKIKYILLFIFIFSFPMVVFAQSKIQPKIRVGHLDYHGFIDKKDDGSVEGYGVDYFNEISKYTNWEYEYIKVEEKDVFDKLENQDIDIMCQATQILDGQTDIEFSLYPIGVEQFVMYTLPKTDMFIDDFEYFVGKKIGLLSTKINRQAFATYAQRNDFEYVEKLYDNDHQLEQALFAGEVDAIGTTNLSLNSEYRVVAKYGANPIYVTAKPKLKILEQLNRALSVIKTDRPELDGELYKKHYGQKAHNTNPMYTRKEFEFIKNSKVIKIGFWSDRKPLSYVDDTGTKVLGINRDIMENISEISGLKFEYIPISKDIPLRNALADNKIDIACGLPALQNFDKTYGAKSSAPFMRNRMLYIVKDRDVSLESKLTIAVSKTAISVIEYIQENLPDYTILQTDDIYSTLTAVASGKADTTLCNEHVAAYYMQKPYLSKLFVSKSKFVDEESMLLLHPSSDPTLISVINKAIISTNISATEGIITAYTAVTNYKMTMWDILYENSTIIISASIFALFIMFLLNKIVKDRKKVIKKIQDINDELVLNQKIYDIVLDKTNDIIFEWDYKSGRIKYSKDVEKRLNRKQVLNGFPYHEKIVEGLHPNDIFAYKRTYDAYAKGEKSSVGEYRIKDQNEHYKWYRSRSTAVYDSDGNLVKVVGMLSDIDNEKHELLEAVDQAKRDTLTGIYNRKAAKEIIDKYIRQGRNGAMMMLDIDNFKKINDEYGHQLGDEFLVSITKEFKEIFRQSDVVSRLGGDEFLIFMPDMDNLKAITQKAIELLQAVQKIKSDKVRDVGISMSIGVSICPEHGNDFSNLYEKADKALYVAKNNGKNTFAVYE